MNKNIITIDLEQAKKTYQAGPDPVKKALKILCGSKLFENIMDRIKTVEDALIYLEENKIPISHFAITQLNNDAGNELKALKAICKLFSIVEALNEGWFPNWEDKNEYKWFPYFKMTGGFGFSDSYYSYANTYTAVGSRLCFKSEELANYAGKQFEAIYKDYLTR